jgi:putative FmdB family regulatory protein
MPLYEYRCRTCGKDFTLLRPMAEATAAATCPACGGSDTERLISSCAIGVTSGGNSCNSGGFS